MPNDQKDAKGGTSREVRKEAEHAPQQQPTSVQAGEVDEKKANHWLGQHWPEDRRLCSVCGVNDWGFVPRIVYMAMSPLGLHMPPRVLPCIGLSCRNCAHTIFFNAIIMEQLPKGEE